jgi:hypothetical protein
MGIGETHFCRNPQRIVELPWLGRVLSHCGHPGEREADLRDSALSRTTRLRAER